MPNKVTLKHQVIMAFKGYPTKEKRNSSLSIFQCKKLGNKLINLGEEISMEQKIQRGQLKQSRTIYQQGVKNRETQASDTRAKMGEPCCG